jgi:hypothetical protein
VGTGTKRGRMWREYASVQRRKRGPAGGQTGSAHRSAGATVGRADEGGAGFRLRSLAPRSLVGYLRNGCDLRRARAADRFAKLRNFDFRKLRFKGTGKEALATQPQPMRRWKRTKRRLSPSPIPPRSAARASGGRMSRFVLKTNDIVAR